MPGGVLALSMGLFAVAAALEGALTLAVVQALERINPRFIQRPERSGRALAALALAAIALAVVGVLFASAYPDGLEKLAENIGIAEQAENLIETPLADYEASFVSGEWARKAFAGLAGLILIFVACAAFGRLIARRRGA
jgi:cobalt/nickel transport system permease protein